MLLASEAEDPQEARAFALPPPLASSALPFKESSEVPGVVIAPPPELPEKFGPEASSISKEKAAAHPNYVHYKPTMAMLPVEGDTTFLGGPTAVAIVKHGEKAATGESQGVLPQIHEPMKKSFGQEGSLSSRKSTKSAESAANLASSENAPVRNVEENPVSAQNLPKTGKRASLSVSSVRVLGESAAIKRPPDVSVTKPSIHEDPCTNVDAAVLAKNIPKSTVATAEQLGAKVDDRPQVPSAEEKPKRDPIPEAKREKKIKSKTRRKGHKRHHKKETG
ncbi:uncharacterized protein LOC142589642 isoform X2 [Dermacentor variabilis]|uniref:uncharacterized protein LOC142589642 isoform X2 n=1 Tax=Dermacentor variabilis TaxID=34621 RepID=UPI003F5BEB93